MRVWAVILTGLPTFTGARKGCPDCPARRDEAGRTGATLAYPAAFIAGC